VDSHAIAWRIDDKGVSSVQFVLASALALILFLTLANLVVVQYGKGAVRSALEQGARAGTISGVAVCEETASQVVDDLLGGRMSDGLVLSCSLSGGSMVASASAVFESWTPLTPDFGFSLSSSAVVEP
jgi:Flp pilus assembly protein TadG